TPIHQAPTLSAAPHPHRLTLERSRPTPVCAKLGSRVESNSTAGMNCDDAGAVPAQIEQRGPSAASATYQAESHRRDLQRPHDAFAAIATAGTVNRFAASSPRARFAWSSVHP